MSSHTMDVLWRTNRCLHTTDVVSHTDRCRLTQIKIVISKSIVIPYFIEFQVSDIPSGAPDDGDGDECCLWPTLARKF